MNTRIWIALSLVILAAAARSIPHPANVSPIIAVALFSGAFFREKSWAILVPLLAMFISDLALGFHDQMVSVYGSIVLVNLLGFALNQRRTAARVAAASILGSLLFYAVTNFTVWNGSGMYSPTVKGLIQCYTMALPFLRNSLFGDLAFTGLLFGAWAITARRESVPVRSQI